MEEISRVYLDHNATTGLSVEVQEALPAFLREFGNPSSIHWASRAPKLVLRETRQDLAKALKVSPLEIIYTSGGSESNTTVVHSVFSRTSRTEYITSRVEHPSVMKTFQMLEKEKGAIVHYLNVDRNGQIDLDQYSDLLSEKTALVSVMLANNETGQIFPIQKMAQMAHAKGALFHSDCVQALGKIPVDLESLQLDYASFSSHKFYALKGSGFLFVKKSAPFESLIYGGGQERHRRGGTENVPGIFALGIQAKKLGEVESSGNRMRTLRDRFEADLLGQISGVSVTSAGSSERLPNTSSLVISDVDGETLLMALDLKGFAVSTGAACSSGNPEPSPVLLAMGLRRDEAQSSLRVSLGWSTTQAQMDQFLIVLVSEIKRLRNLKQQMNYKPSFSGDQQDATARF